MPEFVIDPRVAAQVAEHRYPLLFATISGAHLYGFPSPDSDFDIRGAHILPLHDALGLWPDKHDTVQVSGIRDGLEIDLVTHDLVARKLAGPEQSTLPEADVTFHESECQRLLTQLEAASDASHLPDVPTGSGALNDLLVRVRTGLRSQ